MGKSKTRGGAKAHRKRVQARNSKIKSNQVQMEKMWQDEMMKQMEKLKEQSEESQEEIVAGSNTPTIDMGKVMTPNEDENIPLEIKL
tara:strand:+ start:12707 stop:12967 length:261 start_codon:yes stop_codon:yes gene_type:complete